MTSAEMVPPERDDRQDEDQEDQEVQGDGRKRMEYVLSCALGAASLTGSWVLELDGETVGFQGFIVGEPQPGIYLVEEFNWIDPETIEKRAGKWQVIKTLDDFVEGNYRFFDDDAKLRSVRDAYIAAAHRDRQT